jgi:predicted GIY-YIG superfamily endonuclease
MENNGWYCYILDNDIDNATYNGKTNDLVRRLGEHNGTKKRGAKHTRKFGRDDENNGTWKYIAVVSGIDDERDALRCEWRIKKPEGKRRNGKYSKSKGRIKGLVYALKLDRFTSNCDILTCDMGLTIHTLNEYVDMFEEVYDTIGRDKIKIIGYDTIPYDTL